jgi:hypothetical protein
MLNFLKKLFSVSKPEDKPHPLDGATRKAQEIAQPVEVVKPVAEPVAIKPEVEPVVVAKPKRTARPKVAANAPAKSKTTATTAPKKPRAKKPAQ